MLNKVKGGQTLKLQSYKVDNQVLASKINELNDLKSELENTLNKHRHQQSSIMDEMQQVRAQNQKLRAIVSDLQFTKKSQAYLINQLEKRLEASQDHASKYKQQLEKEQREKLSLTNFYEKKIMMLQEQGKASFKGVKYEISNVKEFQNPLQPSFKVDNLSISSIDSSSKFNSNKKITKLRKPSVKMESNDRPSLQVGDKYMSSNIIMQKEEEMAQSGQDTYLQMIRILFKQLLKIQLRAHDIIKIPQIQAFYNLRNPTRNDLAKLLTSYPFHIRQGHKVDLIFQFIVKQCERRGKLLNGRFVVQHIIKGIQQIDSSQGFKQEGDIYSSFDCDKEQINLKSQKMNRTSYEDIQQDYSKKMSIDSAWQMESDNSDF